MVVVPDGALAYIPFDALFAGSGRRLLEESDVVEAVSLSSLKLIRERTKDRPRAPKLIAVFADPVFSRNDPRVRPGSEMAPQPAPDAELTRSATDVGLSNLDRLVSTRREAAAISALAPEGLRWEALDFEASLSAVSDPKLKDYRIVHFATHGLMNSRDPRLSGLVFSMVDRQGHPRNGFLRADEAANLKLGADLVVLSACQTALGKELRGEGLLGLARSFMYAGSPRVIASLWRVSDSATTELMSSFYRALLVNHIPAGEALRLAKLRLMRDPLHSRPTIGRDSRSKATGANAPSPETLNGRPSVRPRAIPPSSGQAKEAGRLRRGRWSPSRFRAAGTRSRRFGPTRCGARRPKPAARDLLAAPGRWHSTLVE